LERRWDGFLGRLRPERGRDARLRRRLHRGGVTLRRAKAKQRRGADRAEKRRSRKAYRAKGNGEGKRRPERHRRRVGAQHAERGAANHSEEVVVVRGKHQCRHLRLVAELGEEKRRKRDQERATAIRRGGIFLHSVWHQSPGGDREEA